MMMRASALLVPLFLALAGSQGGPPINTMCPVKPNQKAKASNVVLYEGQVIGFC